MTAGTHPEATFPPASPELESGKRNLARSRLLGKLSACVFLIAALAVLDGLQSLVRHDFNTVSIAPGETVILTGMLPQNAARHSDLVVEMEGLSGLAFTPVDSYKGFWMGGNMWRAELTASAAASPGKGTLTVVDMVPLKKVGQTTVRDEDAPRKNAATAVQEKEGVILGQNPALVYSVNVWPSTEAREAAEHSVLRRLTNFHPFVIAGAAAALALLFGIGNSLLFSKAEARLARRGIYFIHGIKIAQGSPCAAFAHAGHDAFTPGDPVLLYNTRWQQQGSGSISGKDRTKGFALFSPLAPPRYGWLVALARKRGVE